jgi:hypothetical protein
MNANLYGSGTNSDDMARTALSERKKDGENRPEVNPLAKRYQREVERYARATSEWHEEGENIIRVYLDESSSSARSTRRFAMLWANVETLKPAVYVRPPAVLCSRRYKDRDPVARTAAELMERATNTSFELYGVDEIFRMVRDDRLLPGRGQAWVRYEATIGQYEDEDGTIDETGEVVMHERLKSEKVCVDYVHWQDFGHNVARVWADVWLVWRCIYKTQDEVADRFGGRVAARLRYSAKAPVGDSNGRAGEEGDNYCKIFEFWDKTNGLTSWMADGEDVFLESGEPPINFSNFFPCPEPVYSTKTSKSLIPKPDYCYYRDQAKEINDLTDKIHRLTEWLMVKGFIPGGPSTVADPLEEALRDKGNKELFVQVESFSEWTERGGAAKLIDWLPIQNVVAAIQAAIQARAQLIQDVFQITGIADILRAQSDPSETLGAQELKAQTGTRRLRNTRDDIARFCKETARLSAEVIAENFSAKTLAEMTGFRYVPVPDPNMLMLPNMANVAMFPSGAAPGQQMQTMDTAPDAVLQRLPGAPQRQNDDDPGLTFDDRVLELLRNDRLRSFRIDIETDSTVQADENAERRSRTEFLEVAGGYLEKAARIIAEAPTLAKTAGEMLMFGIRSFRPGRTIEETIEKDFEALVQEMEARRNQPKPEDPVIQVAKVQVQGEIEKNRANAALKAKEIETDAQLEVRKQDIDARIRIRDQDLDASAKARDTASRIMGGRISQRGLA